MTLVSLCELNGIRVTEMVLTRPYGGRWTADLKVRHQVEPAADKRRVTLACTPKASLTFTLDGSNPRDGIPYEGPFEIGAERESARFTRR